MVLAGVMAITKRSERAMSIEDRDGFEEEFLKRAAEMPIRDRADLEIRIRHLEVFGSRFAELAPAAWHELKGFRFLAMAEITADRGSGEVIHRDAEATDFEYPGILKIAKAWATKYQFDTPLLLQSIVGNIVELAMLEVAGVQELPDSFGVFSSPFIERDGEGVVIGRRTMTFSFSNDLVFDGDLGLQRWNPKKESSARFRKRYLQAAESLFDEQMARVDDAPRPGFDDVRTDWVDWCILRRAGAKEDRSERGIANRYGVSRPAVNKGERKVAAILQLPELKPESD
jgi:hypothetical protein